MTTPNVEELIERLRDPQTRGTTGEWFDRAEGANALQSQAEHMAVLERESETHAKAYGLAIVERDNLRHELKTAQEGWRCECSTDDACRFARERDALRAELEKQQVERLLRIEAGVDALIAERDALRAQLAEIEKAEPSMIYHGRCVIDCGDSGHQDVTEFDESQFKSVEDLIAHLNKLNSYRDRTLEALSKYKGAK